jgi:hypothetical protein
MASTRRFGDMARENAEGVPYVGMTWCIAINGALPSPD